MPTVDPESCFPEIASRLSDEAEALTDQWLDRLGDRLGVRPRRLLPSEHLRDHIPVVIRGAAEFLDAPVAQTPNETVDILRTLSQLRREQGYDIQEVLAEFDILNEIVFERLESWVDEVGLDGGSAVRAAHRLSTVLRMIASVAVGTYREEELRQQQELSGHLAEFAGMVMHELRNPISTAALSVEMLRTERVSGDPEQREKYTTRIGSRLERMRQVLDDLQAVAVAEGARAKPTWRSIGEIIDSVVREVHASAERCGVRIDVTEPETPFEVDAVRVEIALMNLLNNAIKFSDPDKEERWVRIRCNPAGLAGLEGGHQIAVEDNGLGIEPESQNKVFQRFFRERPEIDGTGLGLSITRRIVEQRGGRIWFESEPGRGTTFYVEIPQRLSGEEQSAGQVER